MKIDGSVIMSSRASGNECSPTRGPHTKSCRRRERSRVSSLRRAAPSCARWSGSCGARASTSGPSPTPRGRSRRRCCTRPTSCSSTTASRRRAASISVLRLKANVRTHFVPTILCTLNDLRRERVRALAAGADAVFAPATDVEERRARIWALLRTRALYRRIDRLQRDAAQRDRRPPAVAVALPARPQGADRRARGQRRVPGSVRAGRRTTRGSPTSKSSIEDTRGIFEQVKAAVRTVLDYDRFETGQLVPRDERFRLGEAAAEPIETLRRLATMSERNAHGGEPAGRPRTRRCTAIASWSRRAILNLGMAALRRSRGAQRAGDRDRRDRRGHALPRRRAGRAAAAERAHQHLRALRPPRRGHGDVRARPGARARARRAVARARSGSRTCRRAAARSCSSSGWKRSRRAAGAQPEHAAIQGRVEPPEQP